MHAKNITTLTNTKREFLYLWAGACQVGQQRPEHKRIALVESVAQCSMWYCTALYINSYTAAIRRQLAVMRQSLQIKQFTSKVLVKRDKLSYNESLVQKAELAARSNDPKTTYAIVRQLGEFKPAPLKSVLLKSGSPAQTDRQADER